ncbi:MAG: LUD domain-containing protein [Clostridiales bacterium]|nr:LUD domain-containing protein [Clostridiales bacterium]
MEKWKKRLTQRGFIVEEFQNQQEAVEYLFTQINEKDTVGTGGSTTLTQMNLRERLRNRGNQVLYHSEIPVEKRHELFVQIMSAKAYICSANAISEDGRIWVIDGTGNRLSALCYGPEKVFLLCGKNKLVNGGAKEAMDRMKAVSNPLNCKRLNLNTPCAKRGKCPYPHGEYGPNCLCNFTLEIGRAPWARAFHVLLIHEELGY